MSGMNWKHIAHIENDYKSKFGIPRQSNLVENSSRIVFEPPYNNPDAFRGIEEYSHLWLIWEFSENIREEWSPTVRPPRLGGNVRMGVFATRSPFRPNPIGLSSVKLEEIVHDKDKGMILVVSGADLMNGTPIYDIKPYLAYGDSHPEASGGFSSRVRDYCLEVDFPEELLSRIPAEHHEILKGILAEDPRPSYQKDEERIYGMEYGEYEIKFKVTGKTLHVCEVEADSILHRP